MRGRDQEMREERKRKLVMAFTVDALIGSGPLSGLVTEVTACAELMDSWSRGRLGTYDPSSSVEDAPQAPAVYLSSSSLSAARGALSGSTSLLVVLGHVSDSRQILVYTRTIISSMLCSVYTSTKHGAMAASYARGPHDVRGFELWPPILDVLDMYSTVCFTWSHSCADDPVNLSKPSSASWFQKLSSDYGTQRGFSTIGELNQKRLHVMKPLNTYIWTECPDILQESINHQNK
ncbi:unnamed protein product [Fusarium graminearum]|uniref:Chromosome 4, complete genome n=2 Tax=Gibberella zeae (strain ATCC MYA-4620 / CBS 123657 / FGSC 9075 / NRRL 31084 / PH-1) TaxID=229533 RepID=A0A098DUH6_GIBZE|nr:unnamed protein product [Fusarium graminearum]CZS73140.1 unnamed protein product [Fusarium graminearum]